MRHLIVCQPAAKCDHAAASGPAAWVRRGSVQHVSKKSDSGGERIIQVDVEHLAVNFIAKEVVKKIIPINEIADLQLNTRQLRRLILTGTNQEQVCRCLGAAPWAVISLLRGMRSTPQALWLRF